MHVSAFSRYAEAFECPPDVTQEGIARALGISRAHAALELKRLRQGGYASERIAHVTAAKVRRKVYFGTRTGEERARAIREFAKQKPMVLVDQGERRDVLGAEVVRALRGIGLREVDAVHRVLIADVVDLASTRAPPSPGSARPPPFLGRASELTAVRSWVERPAAPILAVLGVSGIGKTALVEQVAETVGIDPFVRRAFAFETARTFGHSLAEFLAGRGLPRLRNHLSSGSFDPAQVGAILGQDLRGVLVVVDDTDRSPEVCAFIEMSAEAAPGAKFLLTARSRPPAYDERDLAEGRAEELVLEGLDRATTITLAGRLGLAVDPASTDRVFTLTRGHPLAIAMLASAGLRSATRMRRFLEDAVLDGFDERSMPGLRALAVLRRPAPDLRALPTGPSVVRALIRRGLLAEHPEGFALHDLARDMVLSRATHDHLRRAHIRAAKYWTRHGEPLETAHHAVQARDFDRAIAALGSEGMRYAESPRAAELVAILEDLPTARRPTLPLARALEFLGRWGDATPLYASVVAAGTPEATEARLGLGRIASKEGDYDDAERHVRDALERAADPRTRGRAERLLAVVLRKRGAYPDARRFVEAAIDHLTEDPNERTRALHDRAALLHDEGRYDESLQALNMIDGASLPAREAAIFENTRAVNLARIGRMDDAIEAFHRSASRSREAGDGRAAAYAMANAADVFLELGRLGQAREALDSASVDAAGSSDRVLASMIEANLGKLLARLGDPTTAEARLLRSVALLEAVDNPRSLGERCTELARFYADAGDDRAAKEWAARAAGARRSDIAPT